MKISSYKEVIPIGVHLTRSYKVENLAYIALFGGVFALTYIAIRSALMLKLQKFDIGFLLVSSIIVMLTRMLFYVFASPFLIYIKLADFALFFVYYSKMRVPYRLHIVFNEEYENMGYGGKSLVICIASFIADFGIIMMINIMIGVRV